MQNKDEKCPFIRKNEKREYCVLTSLDCKIIQYEKCYKYHAQTQLPKNWNFGVLNIGRKKENREIEKYTRRKKLTFNN